MPKAKEVDDEDSFYADSSADYPDGGPGGARGFGPAHHLHRAARAAPVPTECHALGSLNNASFSLIKPGRPELGVSLTYRGGDDCMKRVVTRSAPPGGGAKPGTSLGAGGGALGTVQWVPTPRQITLHMRCDPDAAADMNDLAAVMLLAQRVRVVETEMCEYLVEWPTRHACPQPPKHAALRVAKAVARPRGLSTFLGLGLLCALAVQATRQRRVLTILARRLRAGDANAWRQAVAALLSKDPPRTSRRYAMEGHEI